MQSDAPITERMTRELPPRRRGRRLVPWLALGLAGAALCYALPPVKFVRVGEQAATSGATGKQVLDAKSAAKDAWDVRLPKLLPQAIDARVLFAALRADPAATREKHSRRVVVGGSYYYFVSGTGRVASKDRSRLAVAMTESGGDEADVTLEMGNIFGNAVRDGTGLFDANDYVNSQEFNQLSEELNKLVETRVLPVLRERAAVGSEVRFTGVAEVPDDDADPRPLRVVPVISEVR